MKGVSNLYLRNNFQNRRKNHGGDELKMNKDILCNLCDICIHIFVSAFVVEKYNRHVRLLSHLKSDLISQPRVFRDGEDDENNPDDQTDPD